MNPEPLPGPPSELTHAPITLIEFNEPFFRTHGIDRGPVFYGASRLNRFDAPDSSYKVLYAGEDAFCAFIETFARAAGTRIITTTALNTKALSKLKCKRPLGLIDLTQPGALVRIGADARLFSGDHRTAQVWSKFFHDHPAKADGLLYPSRLDPLRRAIVLFQDRAPTLIELERQSWYAPGPQRSLLAEIIDHYGLELIETRFVTGRKPAARAVQDSFLP